MSMREATLDDIETLFELRRIAEEDLRLGDDSEELERSRMEADVINDRGCCLVYEVDGKSEGFIYAQHLEQDDKKIVRIRYLYVNPEHRKGVGLTLYRQLEATLKRKGYDPITFGTRHDNRVKIMGKYFGFKFLETLEPLDFYIKSLQ